MESIFKILRKHRKYFQINEYYELHLIERYCRIKASLTDISTDQPSLCRFKFAWKSNGFGVHKYIVGLKIEIIPQVMILNTQLP